MVRTETIEGLIDNRLRFHYDLAADVLYLRLSATSDDETYAEETADSDLLIRSEKTGAPVGLTIISWWKRFGRGELPDSLAELHQQILPWAGKVAA